MKRILKSICDVDEITLGAIRPFDYEWDGTTSFEVPTISIPEEFNIGLIVGPSGSGKSTIAQEIGEYTPPRWDKGKTIAAHFADSQDAIDRLTGVGLNSVPAWCKPYNVLSTGEKHRADIARSLGSGAVIDEYTSVIDRNVAQSMSVAVSRFIRKNGLKRVVFVTCHYDVAEWLNPCWIYETRSRKMLPRGGLQRSTIQLEIIPCGIEAWSMFRDHHYLSGNINRGSRCWLAVWRNTPVAFLSALALPNPYLENAWREHRTVVHPDFQGMGLGVRCSDAVGDVFLAEGKRYFSKTAHPRMGEYREKSPKWRATSKNRMRRQDYKNERISKESKNKLMHADRFCYSHEYIGGTSA
jgi:ABC-type lipoprotein export system ATPase subunit/GNAT superfamily N-acetyltransferase